jgi:small GTP-binding protein
MGELRPSAPRRVVAVGDSSVGKTSLISVIMGQPFNAFEQATVGANWHLYVTTVDGAPFEMQIWDTAGQERYRTLGPLYYRQAVAALVFFDLTRRESFANLSRWIDSFAAIAGASALVFVVGNKRDLAGERDVLAGEAADWARTHGYPYFETSAKTGEGVAALFQSVAEAIAGAPRHMTTEQLIPAATGNCIC